MSEYAHDPSPYARDLYPDHNAVVAGWMADHGWPVTNALPSLAGEVFTWVHESGGRSYSLRITRDALDSIGADDLADILDRLQTDRELRNAPRGAVTLHFDAGRTRLVAGK